jgi:signal transduction histidine kinase
MLMLGAAVLLPLTLFLALQATFSMQAQLRELQADAANRARETSARTDGQLWSDRNALEVLASSEFIAGRDWPKAYTQAAWVQRDHPTWKNVILTDVSARREVWETRSHLVAPPSLPDFIAAYLDAGRGGSDIGGVSGEAPDCPCVTIHARVREAGALRYLLTVEISTSEFQRIVRASAPVGGMASLVDRDGRVVVRWPDDRRRVGFPANLAARNIVAQGKRGVYRSVTREGVHVYAAFETSELSGWSTHVAVRADGLSGLLATSWVLTALAALATFALAAAIVVFTLRRLAEQRREEEQRAQSQKLEAIGQLASVVAHDFNNLLMVIMGSLQRVRPARTDAAMAEHVQNALSAAERGAILTRQLLTFARAEPLLIGEVDLAAVVDGIRDILRQSVGGKVRLAISIADDARHVISDANQLGLALLNLAVNARDAMPEGGDLEIVSLRSKDHKGYIDLVVRDNGEGMPKDVMQRAAEPFFTTKPAGKGTGLGLAQVLSTIRLSGGSVEMESTEGVGTVITLRLRASVESPGSNN